MWPSDWDDNPIGAPIGLMQVEADAVHVPGAVPVEVGDDGGGGVGFPPPAPAPLPLPPPPPQPRMLPRTISTAQAHAVRRGRWCGGLVPLVAGNTGPAHLASPPLVRIILVPPEAMTTTKLLAPMRPDCMQATRCSCFSKSAGKPKPQPREQGDRASANNARFSGA